VIRSRRRHKEPPATPQPIVVTPRPRAPLDETPRPVLGVRRGRARNKAHPEHLNTSQLFAELTEVAAWTSSEGAWQEHATFLLRTGDGRWHDIGFSDPAATELVDWLLQRPGFDVRLLRDLISEPNRRIVTLWQTSPSAR